MYLTHREYTMQCNMHCMGVLPNSDEPHLKSSPFAFHFGQHINWCVYKLPPLSGIAEGLLFLNAG